MWNFRSRCISTALTFLAISGSARAQDPPDSDVEPIIPVTSIADIADLMDVGIDSVELDLLPAASQLLLQMHPGTMAGVFDGRVVAFYGAPLATGASVEQAVESFWVFHRDAFGVDGLQTQVTRSHAFGADSQVLAYQQFIEGLPVEYAVGHVVARGGAQPAVVWAAMNCVSDPPDGFAPISMSGEQALSAIRALPEYSDLTIWSEPQLVVYAGEIEAWGLGAERFGPPVRAWRFRGETEINESVATAAFTFFVDAAIGRLVQVRNDILNFDINGVVTAKVSPIPLPDRPVNPPTAVPIADILVTLNTVPPQTTYTGPTGAFSFVYNGPSGVTLGTNASAGRWQDVDTWTGTELTALGTWDGSSAVNLALNDTPTENSTAQANALHYHTQVHNFFTTRSPWTGLNQKLRVIVNYSGGLTGTGFQGSSLVYVPSDPIKNVPNDACSSIIAHEYGHFIVNQLGLSQAAFGEGFGDSVAVLFTDHSCFAPDFVDGAPTCLRQYAAGGDSANRKYPCDGPSIYDCGAVLAGLWWDLRNEFVAAYGSVIGLERVRQLFVEWAIMTNGGVGMNAAHRLTLREILVVNAGGDDPDTAPDRALICAAALKHGLALDLWPPPTCVIPSTGTVGPLLSFHPPLVFYTSRNGSACDVDGIDPFGIAAADVNGDGAIDVVMACEGTESDANSWKLLLFLGTPAGQTFFQYPPTVIPVHANGRRPAKLAIGTLTINDTAPDALPDIALTLQGVSGIGAGVQILLNTGAAPWYTSSEPTKTRFIPVTAGSVTLQRPIGVAIGDWQGDGRPDIAVAGHDGGVPINRPALGLIQFVPGGSDPTITLPGLNDPLEGRAYDLQYWNNGTIQSPVHFLSITNDVRAEHYVMRYDPNQQTFLRVTQPPPPPSGVSAVQSFGVATADFDLDGDIDLAFSAFSLFDQFRWFQQDATSGEFLDSTQGVQPITFSRPRGISAGKLSKRYQSGTLQIDNDVDLAMAFVPEVVATDVRFNPRMRVFVNRGVPTSPRFEAYSFAVSPNPSDACYTRMPLVVDINGDGRSDILVSNRGGVGGAVGDPSEGLCVILCRP